MIANRLKYFFGLLVINICLFDVACYCNTDSIGFSTFDKFSANRNDFVKDSIELEDVSTEGSIIYFYHSSKYDFIVLDYWSYGEMGKLNILFISDKSFNILIAQDKQFNYNKPMYAKNFKTQETCEFYTFEKGVAIGLYSCNRKKINIDKLRFKNKRNELNKTFKQLIKEINKNI